MNRDDFPGWSASTGIRRWLACNNPWAASAFRMHVVVSIVAIAVSGLRAIIFQCALGTYRRRQTVRFLL